MDISAVKRSFWSSHFPSQVNLNKLIDVFLRYAPRLSLATRFDWQVNCAWGAFLALTIYGLYKKAIFESSDVIESSVIEPSDVTESIVAKPSDVTEVKGNQKNVCLEVWIETLNLGPIGKDQKFNFRERIKTEYGQPIVISEEDFCVELSFRLLKADNSFCSTDAKKQTIEYLYLPLFFFTDKKGDSVSLFFDDFFMTLKLTNSSCGLSFECMLANLDLRKQCVKLQPMFFEDCLYPGPFFNKYLGYSITRFKLDSISHAETLGASELDFYREDSSHFKTYRKLSFTQKESGRVCTCNLEFKKNLGPLSDMNADQKRVYEEGLKDGDVHLIRSIGYNGLDQLWIIVPHKDKEQNNVWFSNLVHALDLDGKTFDCKDRPFRPNTNHHLYWYPFGQFGIIDIPEGCAYKIGKEKISEHEKGGERLQIIFYPEENQQAASS